MARCGIRFRYPVRIVVVHDDGATTAPATTGVAETLPLALAMAESEGYSVRDRCDGGYSQFVPLGPEGEPHFLVTVYPD